MRDVIIVGAGPAGSMLALLLARAGRAVLLLDRADFPRPKPCGDCLSAEAARLLGRHGLLDRVRALPHAELVGWRIFGPERACFSAAFADLGDADPRVQRALAVAREHLDAALLAAARAAGAEVRTGCRVDDLLLDDAAVTGVVARTERGEERLPARVTIGADGLRSRVARRLDAVARRPRVAKLSLTAHVHLVHDLQGYGEMHVGRGICAGIAPVTTESTALYNLTVVADAERFGAEVAREPAAFFRRAVGSLPSLHLELPADLDLLASGPFDVPMRRIVFDGAALVGDAAGYFDPFTGQGVYHALAAAERLAAVLLPALEQMAGAVSARALAPYAATHAALTAGPRRVQRLIDAVLARPALAERAIARIARTPALARAILAVTGDTRSARSLLSPALALALLTPRNPEPRST